METLQKQFQIVKSETRTSHVMEYGDMVSSCLIFDGDKMIKLDVKKINITYQCITEIA